MSAGMFAAGCVLFLSGWVEPGRAAAGQPPASGEVRTFSQYWLVPPEEALKGRPVRFQGVVLCYDAEWGLVYVHDGSETMYFSPRSFPMSVKSGDQVEITGTTAFVAGSRALTNLHLAVAGRAALPPATPLELPDLAKDLGQWVETSGEVRVAEASSGRLALVIHDQGQSCVVFVMVALPADASFKQLVGSYVRVRGINGSKLSNGRLASASITTPRLREVRVLKPSASARERVPVVSIDSLLNRELGAWTNQMVHINGSIAAHKRGEFLAVRDPTGLIRVQVIQTTLAKQSERVDAWGFLEVSPAQTLLKDGFFEPVRLRTQGAAATSVAGVTGGAASTNRTLTRIRDVISLSKEEAGRGIPVRLRGVITFADTDWHNAFLQGRTNAVYVDLKQGNVRAGQWVEVTGHTGAGGYMPEVDNATIQVLGTTNLPAPAKVDLTDLADGHLDSHFVELAGVVRQVQEEPGRLTLTLTTPLGRFKAVILTTGNQPPPAQLVDALVRVRGACSSVANARRQISGVLLHVPGPDQIQIASNAAPPDPFVVESIPIETVGTFDSDLVAGRRVKVSGVVTLTTKGEGFYLQDASGGLRISTQETNQPAVGDTLEVLGFPTMDEFTPRLEEAVFRRTGAGPLPPPKQTTAEQILAEGTDDGEIVQLVGKLLQDVPRSASARLVLQDGSVIFTARLAGQAARAPLPQWRAGSVLRLAGVCSIQGTETHEPASFRLLLAQPGDVKLLHAPSWWTARHTLTLAGGLTLSVLVATGWIGLLRRQVRAQTDIIRRNHQQLAEASRQAGMAEVATSVLHNVGNVLNSVNTSAALIADLVRASKARDIAKVSALLEEHRANLADFLIRQDRAQPLLAYLQALTEQVGSEQTTMLREVRELTQNIDHIKEIVSMQQSLAKVSGVVGFQSVRALIEDALRMNAAALVRHRVSVVRQIRPLARYAP